MAYENYKLTYEKDWSVEDPESELYFPTVETDERKVRQDLQLLFNNVKTALNNLIDALDESSGAANTKITEISGTAATNVQAALEDVFDDLPGLMSAKHTHSNKALLDSYNQTNTAIATAIQYKHQHVNMNVLNSLDATVKEAYDRLVNLLGSITSVTTDISSSGTNAQVPTALAVRSLVLGIPNLDKLFVAVKDVTTYAQVQQAVAAGKAVFAYDGTNLYTFSNEIGTTYMFERLYALDTYLSAGVTVKSLWLGRVDSWSEQSIPLAVLNSPTFTGTPQITMTPTTGDDSHKIADTAFVKQEIAANPAVAIIDYADASEALWSAVFTAYQAGKSLILRIPPDTSSSTQSDKFLSLTSYTKTTNSYPNRERFYFSSLYGDVEEMRCLMKYGSTYSWDASYQKQIAYINSPTFTGTPQITTTPAAGDNSHKIADTAFVQQEIAAALANL